MRKEVEKCFSNTLQLKSMLKETRHAKSRWSTYITLNWSLICLNQCGKSQSDTHGITMNTGAPTSTHWQSHLCQTVVTTSIVYAYEEIEEMRELTYSVRLIGLAWIIAMPESVPATWLCGGVDVEHSHKQLQFHLCIDDPFQLRIVNLCSYALSHKSSLAFWQEMLKIVFKFRSYSRHSAFSSWSWSTISQSGLIIWGN